MGREMRVSFAWGFVILSAIAMVSATDHIVGGNIGWNSGINYTDWVNNQTFVLEDWISFRYQKEQHNVLQVNQSGYDNCTIDNPIGNWSSGKDFIFLNVSKRYYFIEGRGNCYGGMKLTFFVDKVAPAPHPSKNASADAKSDAECVSVSVVSAFVMFVGALFAF